MFEPHNLSSEEQNIDDELVEVRASDSSNQVKCDRVHNSQWTELVGNANQWKQQVKDFAVKIMSVRGRSLGGSIV